MWSRDYFPRSQPKSVKGGIKAQSQRGSFGESWWARRWIAVLESFHVGGRLQRGRIYARQGQVMDLEIAAGQVRAKVQGSRSTPYKVSIALKPIAEPDWDKVIVALATEASFAARLLAGEMPPEVETLATSAGVPLFPAKSHDLQTECSCPDWSNPCKHIAAVYYLLAEQFDRDPFLLFRLRGLEREALFARLTATGEAHAESDEPGSTRTPEPLPSDPALFWALGTLPPDNLGEIGSGSASASFMKRLGALPFWRGQERFEDALEPCYQSARERGIAILLREEATPKGPDRG